MRNKGPRVLVVATSKKTRGGITSVVNFHKKGEQWRNYHCKWIETHIDRNNFLKFFYFIKSFIQFIFLSPFYDIIHIHVASYPSLRRKYFFYLVARLYDKKIISHFHPPGPEVIFEEKNKALYKKVFTWSNCIIVLSPQWKKWLIEALSITNNVEVIYNPAPKVNIENKDFSKKYILFAGTVIKRKGYADLIISFSKIANKYKDWVLIIAGNGEINNGINLVKRLNIEKQVVFLGWVTGEKKRQLFNNSSIFCLASESEGFPMSVIEAWSYGIPVICTLAGGLGDIVVENENALVFNYGDTEKLSQQLNTLIDNEELRKQMSIESLKIVSNLFDLNKINAQIGKIYERLMLK